MKLNLSFLLLLFSCLTYATDISHNIEKMENGNHKVISTVIFQEKTGLAKLEMIIPEGVQVVISTENNLPNKTTDEGFSFYIYKSEKAVEFIYEISSLTQASNISFLLKYSIDNDRYEQELAGLILSKKNVKSADIKTEAILIGTAVGPETTLAANEVYTVQIIALSNYNAKWFKAFCEKKNIVISDLVQWDENNLTKFGLGQFLSKEEGLEKLSNLKKTTGLSDLFLTKRLAE